MCANSGLTMFLCLALGGVSAPKNLPPGYDHFHPDKLNWQAVEKLRAGDAKSAQILLERAALLAPHDRNIARNLAEVKAYRERPLAILDLPLKRAPETAKPDGTITTPAIQAPQGSSGAGAEEAGVPELWPPR